MPFFYIRLSGDFCGHFQILTPFGSHLPLFHQCFTDFAVFIFKFKEEKSILKKMIRVQRTLEPIFAVKYSAKFFEIVCEQTSNGNLSLARKKSIPPIVGPMKSEISEKNQISALYLP